MLRLDLSIWACFNEVFVASVVGDSFVVGRIRMRPYGRSLYRSPFSLVKWEFQHNFQPKINGLRHEYFLDFIAGDFGLKNKHIFQNETI